MKEELEIKDQAGETKAVEVSVTQKPGKRKLTLEEQAKEDADKVLKTKRKTNQSQDNVQKADETNTVLIGNNDFFDKMFSDYFQCVRPGFDALYSDERFPMVNGTPMVVSRCYHFPVKGKYVLFDILDKDEYTEEQIIENKAVLNALGFHYTWIFKNEEVSIADVFEKRMNAEVPKKRIKALRQENVVFAEPTK